MVTSLTELKISTSSSPADEERSAATLEQAPAPRMFPAVAWVISSIQTDVAIRAEVHCELITPVAERAQRGLEAHLVMLQNLQGWERVPAGHQHPQLLSEPED